MAKNQTPVAAAIEETQKPTANNFSLADILNLTAPEAPRHVSVENTSQQPVFFQQQFFRHEMTNHVTHKYAALNSKGEITHYQAICLRLHEPTSNNTTNRNRTIWVATNINPGEYENGAGRTVFRNGNVAMTDHFREPHAGHANPLNGMQVIRGSAQLQLVPAMLDNWTPNDNFAYDTMVLQLQKLNEKTHPVDAEGNALEAEVEYSDPVAILSMKASIYAIYRKNLAKLVEAGRFRLSNIMFVSENSMVPGLALEANYESNNPHLNMKALLGKDSVAQVTYLPTLNSFSGTVLIDPAEYFSEAGLEMGRKPVSDRKAGAEDRHWTMRKGWIADEYGVLCPIVMRVTDSLFNNNGSKTQANGQPIRTRSIAFEEAVATINTFQVDGKLSLHVMETGTKGAYNGTAIFYLEVDNYKGLKSAAIGTTLDTSKIDFASLGDQNLGENAHNFNDEVTLDLANKAPAEQLQQEEHSM